MKVEPVRWLHRVSVASVLLGGSAWLATAQPPAAAPAPAPAPAPAAAPAPAPAPAAAEDYANRPVAYIYGNVPVTRQDLGEFLIARGGADKLDLLVNKKIIEFECAKRGVTVTDKEMEAALLDDLAGLSIKKADFVKAVLPRYGKTLYEWMEDVIKPRLLLSKLCRDRVKVNDDDIKKQFEREYGEKRRVQILMWPKGDDLKVIQSEYGKIRASQEEYDRAARSQANPALASSAGHIKPICKHTYAEDRRVEEIAFQLQVGQVSEIIGTSQGYVVMKLHEVIAPDPKVKFEEVRPRLEKQAFEERMTQEIPKYFAELKQQANPKTLFDGPALWRYDVTPGRGLDDILQGGATTPAAPAPAPAPAPMKK